MDADKEAFRGTTDLVLPTDVTHGERSYPVYEIGHKGCTETPEEATWSDETLTGVFENWDWLESVTLPEASSLRVHARTFRNCTSLKKVQLPPYRDHMAFMLTTYQAFQGCTSLVEVVHPFNAPNYSLRVIDNVVYHYPSYVANYGEWRELVFCPEGKTTLRLSAQDRGLAFPQTFNVTHLIVEADAQENNLALLVPYLTRLQDITFEGEELARFAYPLLLSPDGSKLICVSKDAADPLVLPASVIAIGTGALYGCSQLPAITLPEGLTAIGYKAFGNCTSLSALRLPASLTAIGEGAFSGCTSLASVEIPTSVTALAPGTFENCVGLTTVTLPAGMKSIGSRVFSNCTSLSSITFPASLKSIEEGAFSGCSSLTGIVLPDSVEQLGGHAFAACQNLTTAVLPASFTLLPWQLFWGCTRLQQVNIPISVEAIGDGAFACCDSLQAPTLEPGNTHFVQDGALLYTRNCDTLIYASARLNGTLDIPPYVQVVSPKALAGVQHLKLLVLNSGLRLLNVDYFMTGAPLEEIECRGATPPALGSNSADFLAANQATACLTVPDAFEYRYAKAPGWADFAQRNTYAVADEALTRTEYLSYRAETKRWYASDPVEEAPAIAPTSEAWEEFQARHEAYLHSSLGDSTLMRSSLWRYWHQYLDEGNGAGHIGNGRTVACADGDLHLTETIDNDFVNWLLGPHFVPGSAGVPTRESETKTLVACDSTWNVPGNEYTLFATPSAGVSPSPFFHLPLMANYPYRLTYIMAPDTENLDDPKKNKTNATVQSYSGRLAGNGTPTLTTVATAINTTSTEICSTFEIGTFTFTEFGIPETGNVIIRSRATTIDIHKGFNRSLRIVGIQVDPLEPADPLPTALTEIRPNASSEAQTVNGTCRNRTFDLSGREVTGPLRPGLYIRNGRKFSVR